jgi:hypothetical protein
MSAQQTELLPLSSMTHAAPGTTPPPPPLLQSLAPRHGFLHERLPGAEERAPALRRALMHAHPQLGAQFCEVEGNVATNVPCLLLSRTVACSLPPCQNLYSFAFIF